MRRRNNRRSRTSSVVTILVGVVVTFFVLTSLQDKHNLELGLPNAQLPQGESLQAFAQTLVSSLESDNRAEDADSSAPVSEAVDRDVSVHILDVGQADSILIRAPQKNVLIDAGENNQGSQVLDYLREQGVKKIDILIGTHPHSDHIGGMDTVLDGIDVGQVILPNIPDAVMPSTVTFTDLLEATDRNRVPLNFAEAGKVYDLGLGATLEILGPQFGYEDLNDLSIVSRLDYGETSFLFTGDTTEQAEQDMLAVGVNLNADVLDVPHHGSSTSTSKAFLEAVSPQIVTISCGIDNSYGHPHREVVERLRQVDARILRTDIHGSIVVTSDGESIGYSSEK